VFVELGTGSVLTGLARRLAPGMRTLTCGTVAEVEAVLALVDTATTEAG
jgi:[acyl-carrier-protein] S-malonyltransferase